MPLKSANIPPDSAIMLNRSGCILFALWEELLKSRRSATKTLGQDDIHDLRVASRRFRAALDLFEPIAPTDQTTEIRKKVRNLTRKLGGLRNLDESIIFFKSHMDNGTLTEIPLVTKLTRLRSAEVHQISKSLKNFDHHEIDKQVREMVACMNSGPAVYDNRFSLLAYFSDASIRMFLPIQQQLAAVTRPECHETRHLMRIAIKKWRYFFEIVARVMEHDYNQVLETLKEYQSLLGSMNDMIEFEALVHKMELSANNRNAAVEVLKVEKTGLLARLTTLVENKPLTYTFLI